MPSQRLLERGQWHCNHHQPPRPVINVAWRRADLAASSEVASAVPPGTKPLFHTHEAHQAVRSTCEMEALEDVEHAPLDLVSIDRLLRSTEVHVLDPGSNPASVLIAES